MNCQKLLFVLSALAAFGFDARIYALPPSLQQLYWEELIPGGANNGNSADIRLKRGALDGTNTETLLTTNANGLGSIAALSYVPTLQKLYWGSGPNIFRCNLNGTAFENVVFIPTPGNNSDIRGLAFDSASSTMYWTDIRLQTLIRSDLNGGNRVTLTSDVRAGTLALDRATSHLIFATYGVGGTEGPNDKIERVNQDGTGRQIIVSGGIQLTTLDVDPVAQKLYWVDVGYNALNDTAIRRANLDGTGVEMLFANLPDAIVGIDIDPNENAIYWTSRDEGKIKKAALNGGSIQTILSGLSEPQTILLIPEPSTVVLLMFGATQQFLRRRRRIISSSGRRRT